MKFQRFEQYLKIFPEYKFLFIGDNGQGDIIAGKQMLQSYPNRCKVFIHKVFENGIDFKEPSITDLNTQDLYFFKTYLDLGKKLREIGIFNKSDIIYLTKSFNKEIENPKNIQFKPLFVPNFLLSEVETDFWGYPTDYAKGGKKSNNKEKTVINKEEKIVINKINKTNKRDKKNKRTRRK
jgi:hypothetical protein